MKNLKVVVLFFSALFIFNIGSVFAHPAWGIVVDKQKQVYFSDLETVWKIDAKGNLSVFREGESGRHVHDLAIDADGNVYGTDETYNPQSKKYLRSVWKMTPGGEFSYIISPTEDVPSGMNVWRDSAGNTYSVEPFTSEKKEAKIIKRTPSGETSLVAGGNYGFLDGQKENAQFTVVTDMAFGRDDAIYVTNDDKIRKIDKSGAVTTIYREPENQPKSPDNLEPFSRLFGLTVDDQNDILAADFYNNRLLKINPNGKVSTVFTSDEKDWSPIGAAASGNDVYVLEARTYSSPIHTGNRVVKIESGGKPAILAKMDQAVPPKNSASNEEPTQTTRGDSNYLKSDSTSQNNWLYVLGVIGAIGAAFAAFIILVRRK